MKKIKFMIEKLRLRRFRRYRRIQSNIFGYPIILADKSSFMFMYDEIFHKEVYKFHTKKSSPLIIDCGANIGLSTIYFKTMYPDSQIIAFEPDPEIFEILKNNIASSGFKNITLVNKGLSNTDKIVSFFSEGADGGRIALESDKKNIVNVSLTTLSTYLQNNVDFLKIDIEGAEIEVIEECKDYLGTVHNIFVEYHSQTSQPQQLDKLLSILTHSGFRYYIEQVGITSKHPFIKMDEYLGYDLQLNISAKKYNS